VVKASTPFAVAVLFGAAIAGGCSARPSPEVLVEAWELGEQNRWQEAVPLLKSWLIANPESVAGHFFYGQAYLHVRHPRFALAIGQIRLARSLAEAQGGIGDLSPFMDEHSFHVSFHEKLALAHLRMAYEGINARFPDHMVRRQLELSLEEVVAGLKLDPQRAFLQELEETLLEELAQDRAPRRPESPIPIAGRAGA